MLPTANCIQQLSIHEEITNGAQSEQAVKPRRWYMAVDGNAHQKTLCPVPLGLSEDALISEAMLPSIRTIACLIAAMRHDFSQKSPDVFTQEADWFAARILVLKVEVFYLDVTLKPMLALANERAELFAKQHGLAFNPAKMHMSLHSGRPHNVLIIETDLGLDLPDLGMVKNSQALQKRLPILL